MFCDAKNYVGSYLVIARLLCCVCGGATREEVACSVLEGEVEVAARSLIVWVSLGWRGEVLQQEDLSSLTAHVKRNGYATAKA